jgi:hypothetical protein
MTAKHPLADARGSVEVVAVGRAVLFVAWLFRWSEAETGGVAPIEIKTPMTAPCRRFLFFWVPARESSNPRAAVPRYFCVPHSDTIAWQHLVKKCQFRAVNMAPFPHPHSSCLRRAKRLETRASRGFRSHRNAILFLFFLVESIYPVCYFHARRWVESLRATL